MPETIQEVLERIFKGERQLPKSAVRERVLAEWETVPVEVEEHVVESFSIGMQWTDELIQKAVEELLKKQASGELQYALRGKLVQVSKEETITPSNMAKFLCGYQIGSDFSRYYLEKNKSAKDDEQHLKDFLRFYFDSFPTFILNHDKSPKMDIYKYMYFFLMGMDFSEDKVFKTKEQHKEEEKRGEPTLVPMFTNAKLQYADFHSAYLQSAFFSEADLSNADFSHADLWGAAFMDAMLINADLRFADLQSAGFENAKLKGVKLGGAMFSVKGIMEADFVSSSMADKLQLNDLIIRKLNTLCMIKLFLEDDSLDHTPFGKPQWMVFLRDLRDLRDQLAKMDELIEGLQYRDHLLSEESLTKEQIATINQLFEKLQKVTLLPLEQGAAAKGYEEHVAQVSAYIDQARSLALKAPEPQKDLTMEELLAPPK